MGSSIATPREMLILRATSRGLMPESVQIMRPTNSKPASGGTTQAYATVRSVPGRLAGGGNAARIIADRYGFNSGWMITVPHSADVRIDDRLEIAGRVFEIVGIDAEHSNQISQRLACRETHD